MSKQPTMAELRTQCAALGITPGRSVAETLKRIAEREELRARIEATCDFFLADEPKAEIRPIDPVALEANWRKMQDAKRVMETPVNRRFPLMCGTALGTREGLQSYTPVYRGKPVMSVAEIAAELSGRLR